MYTNNFTGQIGTELGSDVSKVASSLVKNSENIGTNCNDVVIAAIICGAIVLIGILVFLLILKKLNMQEKKSETINNTLASEQNAIAKEKRDKIYDLQNKLLKYIKEKDGASDTDFYVETIKGYIKELDGE